MHLCTKENSPYYVVEDTYNRHCVTNPSVGEMGFCEFTVWCFTLVIDWLDVLSCFLEPHLIYTNKVLLNDMHSFLHLSWLWILVCWCVYWITSKSFTKQIYWRWLWLNNISIHLYLHWNRTAVILMTFSSLAALKVVKMTTFSAASDENVVKTTFPFQCRFKESWQKISKTNVQVLSVYGTHNLPDCTFRYPHT